MAEKLSIRDRIAIRLQSLMAAGLTVWLAEDLAAGRITQGQHDDAIADAAERWDIRGNSQKPFTIVVSTGPRESGREALGNPPTDNHVLAVELEALITQRQKVAPDHTQADEINETSDALGSRWLARMEKQVLSDLHLTEPDTQHVLCDMGVRVTDSYLAIPPGGTAEDGTFQAIVALEVEHDTFELNPFAGPSVPEKEV